jgi:hypothetical protein
VNPFDTNSFKTDAVLGCILIGSLAVCLENDGEVSVSLTYTAICATTVRHLGSSTATPGEQRNQDSLYLKFSGHPEINVGWAVNKSTHSRERENLTDSQHDCACGQERMISTPSMPSDERDKFASQEGNTLSRVFGMLVC